MKKQITLFCALALAAGGFAALVGRTKAFQPAHAAQSTSARSVVAYERDFDNMSGQNISELWDEDQLFWFVDTRADAAIKTRNERKGLEIKSISNGEFGGIGSGGTSNLSKLVQGQRYRVSFYFEMNAAADNATFYMEPYDTDWTGVRITKTDFIVQNWQSTFNLQVHDNVFSFEFVVHKAPEELYIRLFTENFAADETIFIDDFKIEAVDTIWGTNWRNEAIGADDGANGDIEKVYGVEWGPTTVVTRGEGYDRYVKWATPGYTPGSDNYVKFYLNNFGALPLKDRTVRIELDFELAVGSTDLVYVSANYYDPNGIVGIDIWAPYENVTGSGIFNYLSFKDPGKVIVEFTPTVDFAPDAWGDFFYFTFKMGDQLLEAHVTSVVVSYVDGNVAKAGEVIDLINAIGTVENTLECKNKIVAAEEAYAAADDSIKGLVNNYEVLTAARAAYDLYGYKETAKGQLDTWKDAHYDEYRAAQQATITSGIATAKESIDAAADKDAVDTIISALQEQLASIPTDDQLTLQEAKADAKTELENYKSASDYRETEAGQLATIIADGQAAIEAATTVEAVATELNKAKGDIDALKTAAEYEAEEAAALAAAKTAAKTELEGYKNASDYRETEAAQLASIVTDGKAAIDAATDLSGVNAALTVAKGQLDELKTKAQYEAEEAAAELAEAKALAKGQLEAYKNAEDYREAEAGQLATIVSEGKAAIDAATDKAGVTAALNEAKGKADALKTKAQYEAEEAAAQLAAKKERAVSAITNYYNTLAESGKYTEANLALLLKAKDDCIAAINAATTIEEVNAAVTAGQAALEAVEQKQEPEPQPEPEPEPQPEPQPEKKGGCGGSVVAASALISTLALAGFGLLISRKRKQD